MKKTIIILGLVMVTGCSSPPENINNICAIFEDKSGWYEDARDSEKKWGIPIPIMMSIIYQESSFRSNAKPPRTWYLGFIPGPRPSSSYGYAQALDETWDHYMLKTGNQGADRDDFFDTVDFLGWYCTLSHRICGISKRDPYHLYLAYHEGQRGYNQGTWKNKTWLKQTAQKVKKRAINYSRQLKGCRKKLEEDSRDGFLFF